jgi:pantoate--beta-alanine ligase
MMQEISASDPLRAALEAWRVAGEAIAFVPTMGNLHDGHLALIGRAQAMAPRVVVSIFVNPLQFAGNEDFSRYPRTMDADREKLRKAGVHILFTPEVKAMYPRPLTELSKVAVPGLSDILCGASRPGHFEGVATVVAKLFNIVQPAIAVFGEKDYQQLLVIRRMVCDLDFPIEIVGVPTVREQDGLAMSSRNGYLTVEERRLAPKLYAMLSETQRRLQAGERDYPALVRDGQAALSRAGFRPDYVAVRRAQDLGRPDAKETQFSVLAAAWLGSARLIDNVRVAL